MIERPVVFVAPHIRMGSAQLRAVQIAGELRRRGLESRTVSSGEGIRDSILIYIKGDDLDAIAAARGRNNRIVVDLIDPHQKTFHQPGQGRKHFHEVDCGLLDGVLFVNSRCRDEGRTWVGETPWAVIPHPWDERFTQPPMDHERFCLLSLGHSGSELVHPLLTSIDLPNHVLTQEMVRSARRFSCHLSIRDVSGVGSQERFGDAAIRYHSKSNIKVSTAAACGANIIASRDAGSTDVLPTDYPFWYDEREPVDEVIQRVKAGFGGADWHAGLDMMASLRSQTSTSSVVNQYLTFLSKI